MSAAIRFLPILLGFEYATMDRLLAESDIVTLHSPLTEKTHHLLGREQFARMKPGAMIVNTSRGGLIDTDALVEALESGKLGGAGLDVLEGEELIKEEKAVAAAASRCGAAAHGGAQSRAAGARQCCVHAAQRVQQPGSAGAHFGSDAGQSGGVSRRAAGAPRGLKKFQI